MKKEISAGAVIFKREKEGIRFLLIKKSDKDEWEFPKGGIKLGEKLKETAKREIKEEAGMEDVEFFQGFKTKEKYKPDPSTFKTVHIFLSESDGEVELSEEHDDYKWVSYSNLKDLIDYPSKMEVFKEAYEFINTELNK